MSLQIKLNCDRCSEPLGKDWVVVIHESTDKDWVLPGVGGVNPDYGLPRWKEEHLHKACLEQYKAEKKAREKALRDGLPFEGLKGEGSIPGRCPKCGRSDLDSNQGYDYYQSEEVTHECHECKARYKEYWKPIRWEEIRRNQD